MNRKIMWSYGVLFLTFFMITSVHADQLVKSKCGVGSNIWDGQRGTIAYSSADSTNNFFIRPLSIAWQLSGCRGGERNHQDVTRGQVSFLEMNAVYIAEEMSIGQGEYLNAYAYLLGCNETNLTEFARVAQNNYGEIYSDPDNHTHILAKTKEVIRANQQLSTTCRSL